MCGSRAVWLTCCTFLLALPPIFSNTYNFGEFCNGPVGVRRVCLARGSLAFSHSTAYSTTALDLRCFFLQQRGCAVDCGVIIFTKRSVSPHAFLVVLLRSRFPVIIAAPRPAGWIQYPRVVLSSSILRREGPPDTAAPRDVADRRTRTFLPRSKTFKRNSFTKRRQRCHGAVFGSKTAVDYNFKLETSGNQPLTNKNPLYLACPPPRLPRLSQDGSLVETHVSIWRSFITIISN